MSSTTQDDHQHLKRFWSLLNFKGGLPKTVQDIRLLVQVEMMKHYNNGAICRILSGQVERHLTRILVDDTKYYCTTSRRLIKDPDVRRVIDLLVEEDLKWIIRTNLEGIMYLNASWHHWNN